MPAAAAMPAVLNAALRVLIVEDDQRYRTMLTTMLRDLECEPAGVPSAADAQQWLSDNAADLILLDLNLPRVDGLTFLKQLRQRDERTPVIILTGVGTLATAQTAIRLNVTEFLTKPCHLGTLESALQRIRARRAESVRQRRASGEANDADDAGVLPSPPPSLPSTSPDATSASAAPIAPRRMIDIEREAILSALQRHAGNRSAAARELGISRRTLHYRLVEYRQQGILPRETPDQGEAEHHDREPAE